jgi:subtilisin family serine protease
LVNREFYLRPYTPIEPEYTLQLRPELCLDVNITEIANELQSIPGVTLIHSFDLPTFKAITFTGNPGPEILNDDRFVDYNSTAAETKAELDTVSGHSAQLVVSEKDVELLTSKQVVPSGVHRTILNLPTGNNSIMNMAQNSSLMNTTLPTITPMTTGCEIQRTVNLNNNTNMSAFDINVDIAILDSGVSLNHPDLNVYRNVTFINGTINGDDDNSHGSIVAGIAAAKDNDIGIAGTAPGARVWAIKVCDFEGECKISNQMKGIEYAIKHADEIDVLNISIENRNSPALNSIIKEAIKAGITVVVAAGNQGEDASKTSPANNPDVITVSAIGDSDGICGGEGPTMHTHYGDIITDDSFASFSNFGPDVKMAAPGVNILSTTNGTGYAVDSGTSMAAPYVSGYAALYKSLYPYSMPSEVMSYVLSQGSSPNAICDGGANGYFTGDVDTMQEPLLYNQILY